MSPKPRIYVSSAMSANLNADQQAFKDALLAQLVSHGYDPQEFHVSGLPRGDSWNFDRCKAVMARCHAAVILAFARWTETSGRVLATEYNHFEGAVALVLDKQLFIVRDDCVVPRGIADFGGGQFILSRPTGTGAGWLSSVEFRRHFDTWHSQVSARHHVFFGYCGKASSTAATIIRYLTSLGVAVRDWQINFRPAGVVLDEIEEAAKNCIGGIFLFSRDDELVGSDASHAAPRDNVVFEAGFFMHAVGRERTLIIREEGAKMPADLGGGIYLPLADRNNISTIESHLRKFIETRI